MKKKLMGVLTAVTLLIGSVQPVYADMEISQDGQNAEIYVEYDNPSTFCVNIPETINLNDNNGYKFTASLMNITESERVCVYVLDESISMYNEKGEMGTARLYGADGSKVVATFLSGQTESQTKMYSSFSGVAAGHYQGTVTFKIRLEIQ